MEGSSPASRIHRRHLIAGGVTLAAAAALPHIARAAPGRLEIAGAQLQRDGAPIRLLGVAVGDPLYIRKNRPLSDYAVIAEVWRANTVRISVLPGHWRNDRLQTLSALSENVAAARAAGLITIICWHPIGFPERYTTRPEPSWGLPDNIFDTDLALAKAFWTQMAQTFGRDPGIIFELWNEPTVDPKLWVSTGEHWPLMKRTWLTLLGAIRPHSDAIVLATGGRWAYDLKGIARDLIDDDRVAYAWHVYPPADRGQPERWLDSLDGLHLVRPVVVTEWGFERNGPSHIRGTPQDFATPFTRKMLEGLNLHSTAWCWAAGAAPAMLEADWQSTTEYGRFVRNYLDTAKRAPAQKVPA